MIMRTLRNAAGAMLASALLAGCGAGKEPPVVVLGLDGADWDLLLPWMEAGDLPNLQAFLEGAAVGDLETVYPILSPVCWTSGFTGVNPGKHGIYDFQKQDPAGGPPLMESATNRRAQPVWMLLSDEGHRVGVMNVPMTYPPDPVRGNMISGFPFPGEDVTITYPPELHAKLVDYPLDFLGLSMRNRTPDRMLADFHRGLEARGRIAKEWIESGDYDFLWLVFTAPDKVQHFFWKYMDPAHPNHDPVEAKRFGTAIHDLWVRQDQILGDLFAALPEDARVILMSDHGFEAIYRLVNMSNWLETTDLPAWLRDHAIPPMLITNGILHHVLEGRLAGGSDREAFCDTFIAACGELTDPANGKSPFQFLFRREDIYSGRMLVKAPDIVIQEAPFYYVTSGVPDSLGGAPPIQDLWTTSFSAYHRPEGIIAVRGPSVVKHTSGALRTRLAGGGDFRDARIMDVAATVLALFGKTVPDVMDGRVLDEVLAPAWLAEHPVRRGEVPGFLLDRPAPGPGEGDREAMRALPYLQ